MISSVDQSTSNSLLSSTSSSSTSSSANNVFASLLSSQLQQMQSSLASGDTSLSDATSLQNQFTLQDLNCMASLALTQQNVAAYSVAEAGISIADKVTSANQSSSSSSTQANAASNASTSSTASTTVASNASPSQQFLSWEAGDTSVNSVGTYDPEVQNSTGTFFSA